MIFAAEMKYMHTYLQTSDGFGYPKLGFPVPDPSLDDTCVRLTFLLNHV